MSKTELKIFYSLAKLSTDLMSKDTKIGIVTAAGYDEAERYYGRLHGLLDAIKASEILSLEQQKNIVIMGESHSAFKVSS